MSKQLMDIVLPRLAERLYGQLEQYHSGQMSDREFATSFADLLQNQYTWLADQGMNESEAAVSIHAAVLVLSRPGLQAEAEQREVPLEVVECQAVRAAAADVARNHGADECTAFEEIGDIVAKYAE